MGHKSNPIGLRLQINRTWDSRWYAEGKSYAKLLEEDLKIRKFIVETLPQAAICLAGGRSLLADHGRSIFQSGANAAISGNLLTTCGIDIDDDLKTLSELGFETKMP